MSNFIIRVPTTNTVRYFKVKGNFTQLTYTTNEPLKKLFLYDREIKKNVPE